MSFKHTFFIYLWQHKCTVFHFTFFHVWFSFRQTFKMFHSDGQPSHCKSLTLVIALCGHITARICSHFTEKVHITAQTLLYDVWILKEMIMPQYIGPNKDPNQKCSKRLLWGLQNISVVNTIFPKLQCCFRGLSVPHFINVTWSL